MINLFYTQRMRDRTPSWVETDLIVPFQLLAL